VVYEGDIMRRRVAKPVERILIMKVIQSNLYGMVRGFPYRVLAVPEEFTLYQLAQAINESFGFDFDHPFGFYSDPAMYYESKEGYELFSDLPDTKSMFGEPSFGSVKKARVKNVFTEPKKKMLYLFDYGDEWHFLVQLLTIEPAKPGKLYPDCIKKVGKARPQYDEPDEMDELCRIDDEEDDRIDDDEDDRKGCLRRDIKQKIQMTLSKFEISTGKKPRKS
jgi:hypothetical protein